MGFWMIIHSKGTNPIYNVKFHNKQYAKIKKAIIRYNQKQQTCMIRCER